MVDLPEPDGPEMTIGRCFCNSKDILISSCECDGSWVGGRRYL